MFDEYKWYKVIIITGKKVAKTGDFNFLKFF